MLIDVKTGDIHVPGVGIFGPATQWEEFERSDLNGLCRPLHLTRTGVLTGLPDTFYKDVRLIVCLAFKFGKPLRGVEWNVDLSCEGKTWETWTPDAIVRDKRAMEFILEEDLGPPHAIRQIGNSMNENSRYIDRTCDYHFAWGTVILWYNGISGSLSADMYYVRNSPFYLRTAVIENMRQFKDVMAGLRESE